MVTIALVGCVKSKRPGRHEAQNLYNSTLLTYSRQYAEANADRWFILSAKHGLLEPKAVIDSYSGTLKNVAPKIKQRWAQMVYEQIMALNLDSRNVRILWLAGNDYKGVLSPMLSRF